MKITYSRKETRNLGNYENTSIEISAEDIRHDHESQEECLERLSKFVNTELNKCEFKHAKLEKKEKLNKDEERIQDEIIDLTTIAIEVVAEIEKRIKKGEVIEEYDTLILGEYKKFLKLSSLDKEKYVKNKELVQKQKDALLEEAKQYNESRKEVEVTEELGTLLVEEIKRFANFSVDRSMFSADRSTNISRDYREEEIANLRKLALEHSSSSRDVRVKIKDKLIELCQKDNATFDDLQSEKIIVMKEFVYRLVGLLPESEVKAAS